jgi:hypothetical protein
MDGSIEGTDTKAEISLESDFSDPANPKSKGTVGMEFEIFGVAISLKSEFICVSSTDCYIKYTEYTIPDEMGTEATTAFLNKWLQFNPYDDTAFADPFGMIVGLNTVLGDIITGNITGDAKAKIEQAAKDGSAYSFTSSVEEQVNGKSALKFDVTVNKDKVLELNKAVAAQYQLKDETKSDDIIDKMNVWVATDNDQIVKAESTVDGVKITLDISKQGESITIEAPTDYLTTDQYSQIFN